MCWACYVFYRLLPPVVPAGRSSTLHASPSCLLFHHYALNNNGSIFGRRPPILVVAAVLMELCEFIGSMFMSRFSAGPGSDRWRSLLVVAGQWTSLRIYSLA